MKRLLVVIAFAILAMSPLVPAAFAGDEHGVPAANTVDPDRVAADVNAIRQAPDPSAVVAAYARAVADDPLDMTPVDAYVSRMVELGVPMMAYAQARDLVQHEPANGLAWGVMAATDARRGLFPTAYAEIVAAVRHAFDDPFVRRVAGEMMAWYDLNKDQLKLSDSAQKSLEAMRKQLANQEVFTAAYKNARDWFLEQRKAEQQAQAKAQPPDQGTNPPNTPAEPAIQVPPPAENNPPIVVPETYVLPPEDTYGYDTYPLDYGFYGDVFPFDYGSSYYGGFSCYPGFSYFGGPCWWGGEPCFINGFGYGGQWWGFGGRGFDAFRRWGGGRFGELGRGAFGFGRGLNGGRLGFGRGLNGGALGTGPIIAGARLGAGTINPALHSPSSVTFPNRVSGVAPGANNHSLSGITGPRAAAASTTVVNRSASATMHRRTTGRSAIAASSATAGHSATARPLAEPDRSAVAAH